MEHLVAFNHNFKNSIHLFCHLFFHPSVSPRHKQQLCFLISVYDRRLVIAVRPGPAHTCHSGDGTDNAGTAFIIIDIPHSHPITSIAAHAVTSDPLIHSSRNAAKLPVSAGKARFIFCPVTQTPEPASTNTRRRQPQGGQRSEVS